jgi:phosphatidylglycerophosphate synthase
VIGAALIGSLAAGTRPLGIASWITLLRVAIVAAAVPIGLACPVPAAVALLAAALLDFLDGALARRLRQATAAGARLDVEADAYFVAATSLLVIALGRAGEWVLIPALLRPLLVLFRTKSRITVERRTAGGRAAFGVVAAGLIATCASPHWLPRAVLMAGVAAVGASFAVDFRLVLARKP